MNLRSLTSLLLSLAFIPFKKGHEPAQLFAR